MGNSNTMKRREFVLQLAKLAGAVGLAFGTCGAVAASVAQLSSVRVNRKGSDRLVLSIALTSVAKYKIFALTKPNRIVIDFMGATAPTHLKLAAHLL